MKQDLIQKTLEDICADQTAPAAARVQAARTLAEMQGLIGRTQTQGIGQEDTTPQSEMTPTQIDFMLEKLLSEKA